MTKHILANVSLVLSVMVLDGVCATGGVRELVWNGGYNGIWDTSGVNWLETGSAAVFTNGDSAVFDLGGNNTITMGEDLDVSDVSLTIRYVFSILYAINDSWSLAGSGRTLGVYGTFKINDAANSPNNAIAAPRVTGPGGFTLERGRFRIGNSANDFTGGVKILGGMFDATFSGAGATTVGSGDITLGSSGFLPSAIFNFNAAAAATAVAGGIHLTGGMNTGKINLVPGAYTLGATFAGIAQVPNSGGTLQIGIPNGATADIGGFASGAMLPPYIVTTAGEYLEKGVAAVAPIANYASHNVFTGTSLAANAGHTAARLTGNLDLGGFTLGLGGASINGGVSVSNGALDLGAGDSYFYVPSGAATVSAALAGTGTLRKFGSGRLELTGGQDYNIVNQEEWVALRPPSDMDYHGILTGSGAYIIRDNTITLKRPGYEINGICVNEGGLIVGGDTQVYNNGTLLIGPRAEGNMYNFNGGTTIIRDGACWTQGPERNLEMAYANNYWIAHNLMLAITGVSPVDGAPTTLDLNGGNIQMGGMQSGDRGSVGNNFITVTDGAVVTNTSIVQLGYDQGGSGNNIIVSKGGQMRTRATYMSLSGSHDNTIAVTGSGSLWDNGNGPFWIAENNDGGTTSHCSLLLDDHARMVNVNGLRIGTRSRADRGGNISNHSVTIANNAELIMTGGNVDIATGNSTGTGREAMYNKLVLADGGNIVVPGGINVGMNDWYSYGNAVVLAGGGAAAASLNITAGNRLDLILGESGMKPLVLTTGNAAFAPGSSIAAFCPDFTKADGIYPVIVCENGVVTGIEPGTYPLETTQSKFAYKLFLSPGAKVLSLGIFTKTTLLTIY